MKIEDGCALSLYRSMLRIRVIEEYIAGIYPEQEIRCPVHLCIGQEAIPAGVSATLKATDYVLSGHRAHGHYLAKGGNLKAMMAELYGREAGCAKGYGGSMHLVDLAAGFLGTAPIVGSTIPIAVGAAFKAKLKNEERVSVVYLGDGATETGVFYESLNFAALKQLAVLFVIENNAYSVYTPLNDRQPKGREVTEVANAMVVNAREGNGNDVEEVYRLAFDAVTRARAGKGPELLYLNTYRSREHCGPNYDDDLGYRSETDVDAWRLRCPLATYERVLKERRILDQAHKLRVEGIYRDEIVAATEYAKNCSFPSEMKVYENVFAD